MNCYNCLTYNNPSKPYKGKLKSVTPYVNYHKLFQNYVEKMEYARDKVETDITDFIKKEWNDNLELCVELEDIGLVTIWVGEEIEKEYFYQFIIKPICEKYDLKLQYTEIVEGVCPYIEWGLSSDC